MALIQDKAVKINANSINKTLYQAIVDGDIGAGGGGGGGKVEIFSHTVTVSGSSYATLTGLSYYIAPASQNISYVRLQVFTLNGVATGSLTVDIKKNTSPDNTGMASIFSAQPSIDFSTASNYATSAGTLSTSALATNDVLRLDVTSIPPSWVGSFIISVYA
jgi:hypothetical protein